MSKGRELRGFLWVTLIVVAALAVGTASVVVWRHTTQTASPVPATSSTASPSLSSGVGAQGSGDPYFADYGAGGYDALSYDIDVGWDPHSNRLSGKTTMTARASAAVDQWVAFSVDLYLPVTRVLVDDGAATFTQSAGSRDVIVRPQEPVAGGSEFTVTVEYAGNPASYVGATPGWLTTGQEWLAAGEPESAPLWFASNDHPSDPATYDISIRVPSTMQALSAGRLTSKDTADEDGWDTWNYAQDQAVPTYAVFLAIGSFQIETGTDSGRPFVYAVSRQIPTEERSRIFAVLRTTGAIVRSLEEFMGPYPLSDLGGVVPRAEFWFGALETAGRPVYRHDSVSADVVAHEMAHMWVGNTVTMKQWKDIYINEALASYATWVVDERTGGTTAAARLADGYAQAGSAMWRVSMSDPGARLLFTTVYVRGPMSLQALRNRFANDSEFFAMWRAWAQQTGPRSLADFRSFAAQRAGTDLTPFFRAWIDVTQRPAKTSANGLA